MQSLFFRGTFPYADIFPFATVTHFLERIGKFLSERFFGMFGIIVSKSTKIVECLQVYFADKSDALGNSVTFQSVELTVNVLLCSFGVSKILFHTVVNILFAPALFKAFTFFIQFVEQLPSGYLSCCRRL